jgi:hypothetical protein
MATRPIEIACDVLRRTQEPQVRRNAITALGVLGTPDAARTIASTAVEDDDPAVRAHAATEVLRLQPGDRSFAVDTLYVLLRNPACGTRSYELLGRLRSTEGTSVHLGLSLLESLRLESHLNKALLPRTWWKPRSRAIAATLLGTAAAFVPVALLVTRRLDAAVFSQATLSWMIYSGILAILLGAASTLRTTPTGLHPSRVAGLLVEIGWVFLLTLGLAVLLLWIGTLEGRLALSFLALPPFAAAVRAGSIIGGSGRFRGQMGRTAWAIITGGSVGVLVCAAATVLVELLLGAGAEMLSLFVPLVPVSFGLAYGFARVDKKHAEHSEGRGSEAGITAAGIAAAAAALVAWFLAAPAPPTPTFANIPEAAESLDLTSPNGGVIQVPLDTLPKRVTIRARSGGVVRLEATDYVDNVDITFAVFDAQGAVVSPEDDNVTTTLRVENAAPLVVVVDRWPSRRIEALVSAQSIDQRIAQRFSLEQPRELPSSYGISTAVYPDTGTPSAGPALTADTAAAPPPRNPKRRVLRVRWGRLL